MPRPFSQDLRDRVLAAYDRGMKTRPIARMFKISPAWARRVKQRRRQFNQTSPRSPGPIVVVFKVDRARLAELVKEDPDATLMELRQRLNVECGLSTICMALKELKLTFKKKRCTPPNRIGPTSSSGAINGEPGNKRSSQGN